MMKPFEKIIERVITNKNQVKEAINIAKERNVPNGDALHSVIARDNNLILITRDNHFKLLSDIAAHYKPEDII